MKQPTAPEASDLFEILVRENADMLMTFLRSIVGDETVVEDLFQETFLVAWKNLVRYDRSRPFGPWIRGIAGRLVLAERRRSTRLRLVEPGDLERLELLFRSFDDRRGDTWGEKLDALNRCLERLRPPLRQVLTLRYEGGLGCQSIAEKVGSSTEAAKKRLQRARSIVAECLQGLWGDGEGEVNVRRV